MKKVIILLAVLLVPSGVLHITGLGQLIFVSLVGAAVTYSAVVSFVIWSWSLLIAISAVGAIKAGVEEFRVWQDN